MNPALAIAIVLHLLSAVVWVGGMFFAYMALRPAAASRLQPPQRLTLWVATFARFFPWVWLAIILLPASGYWMVFMVMGGMGQVGLHIHLMQALGIPMILIFLHLYFAPYQRLCRAVTIEDWPAAGAQLATIRKMIGFNLILGLLVVLVGSGGRYF